MKLAIMKKDLSLLLEDSVNNGASIGFLAPVEKNEVLNYWREVNHKLAQGNSRLWIAIQEGKILGSVQLSLVSKRMAFIEQKLKNSWF